MAKKRKKSVAKKRKKQNLAGMDFQGLMDLREQVEGALVSQRATLERQLQALGGSLAGYWVAMYPAGEPRRHGADRGRDYVRAADDDPVAATLD